MNFAYAAAAYGLTRPAQLATFQWLLGATVLAWLCGHFLQGRWPRTGRWPWIFSLAILAFGWFVTVIGWIDAAVMDEVLPQSVEDFIPLWVFIHLGTYDPELSIAAMLRTTVLLGGMLMAIDYWNDATRARTLLLTLVLVSFGMVLFFFEQKIVDSSLALTAIDGKHTLAFATYRYHGNGAAYLNLCWPFAVALAVYATVRQTFLWPMWLIPLAATFIATFLNVSKAGNVLAGIGVILMIALCIPFVSKYLKRRKKIRRSRLLAALVPMLIIVMAVPFALPWQRWQYFAQNVEEPGSRPDAYEYFAKMAGDAGIGGFGPGTFGRYSDRYLWDDLILRDFQYDFAHEDYLQTVIEWGYIGAGLWALLLVPPYFLLLRGTARVPERRRKDFEGYRINVLDHISAFFNAIPNSREACVAAAGATAAILTALHAVVDFPMQIASLQFYFLTVMALGWSYLLPESAASSDFGHEPA